VKRLLKKGAAVCGGSVVLAGVVLAVAAGGSGAASADGLRAQSAALGARAQAATLELYALETELARARAALADVSVRRDALERERASARRQLRVTRQALRVSEARLGEIVRALYEGSGGEDPLAILLGAASLEEALSGLDNLDRAAGENDRIVEQARSSRARLTKLEERLSARAAELDRLAAEARERARSLTATAADRRSLIASLRRQQGLNAQRISAIEAAARAAEARSREIQASAPPVATAAVAPAPAAPEETLEPAAAPAPVPEVSADGTTTLTVEATGYALRGRTATGIPTGPGVVAVDPSVIPLGTRLTIPGYGIGIAADTGGAVNGNVIDVWFPTTAQALAWGRRTVTITIH
jgi:peptidoglycan DL-endopeptidase CwlO